MIILKSIGNNVGEHMQININMIWKRVCYHMVDKDRMNDGCDMLLAKAYISNLLTDLLISPEEEKNSNVVLHPIVERNSILEILSVFDITCNEQIRLMVKPFILKQNITTYLNWLLNNNYVTNITKNKTTKMVKFIFKKGDVIQVLIIYFIFLT